ncbi:DUF6711 family protein [Brochothrix thermosphacta]|uniref:DUF6711 family protein n=1 Tax=Brochothrix thermosphacta TaxID=2756 RepID=UPI00083F7F1B|nr:DUF6711 family protein [Brochothrix thermosphacta]ODJ54791.1 hypothetical protein BFR41_06710 [Brochothrix thermosphacta]ODJ63239.1 hypothetical protein BFR35_01265 [Brochothrix thermosphacta]ODJ66961.1 hypothetical protein BFR37_07530 [Brochothrix thermosphacta]ODJ71978.1 hypothetical protein BFR39_04360 [Brochothrix thermosphacta]
MAGTISIAGAVVKTPKSFVVGLQDIDNDSSGRNANGKMVRDVIAKKVKLDIEWGPLSDSEASAILSRINGSFFSVNYPDPLAGGQVTKTFYAGDRTIPSYSWNDKYKSMKWEGVTVNFIEQ